MKYILILLAAFAASGCEMGDVSDGMGSGDIKMYTLPDGTKCAVLIGYSKGAIDCNWKNINIDK